MQDEEPNIDVSIKEEEDRECDESFMYFIRTGEFEVSIKSSFGLDSDDKTGGSSRKKMLYDGDHFGEIGLIFDSKRTASVKSINYGSLAKLNKSGYKELKKSFSTKETSIERCFKEYMFKYKDDLRTFLEIECDKI